MTRDPKNDLFARLSDRTKFVALGLWSAFFCRTGEVCLTGDVSGDRCSDVIAFNHGLDGTNAVLIGLSNGAGFGPATKAHDFFCTKSELRRDLIAFTRGANPRVFVGISQ
jgi:hypothetical protein